MAKSVKFNAVMNTLLTGSNMMINIIMIPYVTRVLSVEGYGNVTFAQSISSWLSTICLLGIGTYGIRECSRVRDNPRELATVVRELLCIITISTLIVLACFAVAIVSVPKLSRLSILMWLFLLNTLVLSYGVEWYFQALEDYQYITIRSIAFKVLSLILTFLLVRNPDDYISYGFILALISSGNNILNFIRLCRSVDWAECNEINIKRHFRPLISFATLSISSAVYLNLDSVILGLVAENNYQVGLYQLAVKIKGVMWSVVNAVISVLIPRLANYTANKDWCGFNQLIKKGMSLTIDGCVALAGLFLVNASPIAVLISGESFLGAAPAIRIVGIVNLLSSLSYFIGLCVLSPLGREKELAVGNLMGVPISLVLNILLDGPLGSLGAALSMMVAELVIFSYQLFKAKDQWGNMFEMNNFKKVLIGNLLAMLASLISLNILPAQSVAIKALVNTPLYFTVLMACLILLREEGAGQICRAAQSMLKKLPRR